MTEIYALVDCDSFFVSCEQARDKDLIGKPICVVGGMNGCVLSRSKEAKKMGVPMGYPYFMANKEYNDCIYVDAHMEYYKECSSKVMAVLKDFSPYIEVCSIDEAYVDFTGLCKLYKRNYYDLALLLRKNVLDEVGIPVSIGVSMTKTLAKFASDYAKNTGGVYLIGKSKLKKILEKTNIEDICGVGKRMKIALNKEGILTCKEFVERNDTWIKNKFSVTYLELKHELLGERIYKINNEYEAPKSIQETSSFVPYSNNIDYLKSEINRHIKDACRKLRRHCGTVSQIGVMLKDTDFIVYTDKMNLDFPSDSELEIAKIAFKVFEKIYNKNLMYRTSGVFFNNLNCTEALQIGLFNDTRTKNEKLKNLSKSIDKIEAKYGKNSIKNGFI